ncbi:MAG: helix-turn-helix domain-containing protein [Candidatus Moraniibacteriota bacterium]
MRDTGIRGLLHIMQALSEARREVEQQEAPPSNHALLLAQALCEIYPRFFPKSRRISLSVFRKKYPKRYYFIIHPRQALMYLLHEALNREEQLSYGAIGRFLGNMDHATVSFGCQAAAKRIQEDLQLCCCMGAIWKRYRELHGES